MRDIPSGYKFVVPATDSLSAPTVPTLPMGLELVGHVDADVSMASLIPVHVSPMNVPGSKRAHAIVWGKGTDPLTVMTLPGTAADVTAFIARPQLMPRGTTTRAVEVDDRPGVRYLGPGPSGEVRPLMLATTTSWGDVLTVTTNPGCCTKPPGTALSEKTLIAVASSVEKVSASKLKTLVGTQKGR